MKIIGSYWSPGATYFYIKCECGNTVYHNIKKKTATCPLCKGQQTVESMPVITIEEREREAKEKV